MPTLAALAGGQSIEHSSIGSLLKAQIERRIDAQAGLMDLSAPKLPFKLPP